MHGDCRVATPIEPSEIRDGKRRPYARPCLRSFGSVRLITGSSGGSLVDALDPLKGSNATGMSMGRAR